MDPAPLNQIGYSLELNDIFPFRLSVTLHKNEREPLSLLTFEELVMGEELIGDPIAKGPAKISIIQDENSTHLYCLDTETFETCGGIRKPNPLTRNTIQKVFNYQCLDNRNFVKIADQGPSLKKSSSKKMEAEKLFTPLKITDASIFLEDIETKNQEPAFPQIIALTFENNNYCCFDAVLLSDNKELRKITDAFFFKLSEQNDVYKWLHKKSELTEDFKELFYKALAGNKEAEVKVGDHYLDKKNKEEAYFWYIRASDKGCLQAKLKLGKWFLDGKRTVENYLNAEKLFQEVIDKSPKNEEAKIQLALILTKRGKYQEAFVLLKEVTPTKEVEYVKGMYFLEGTRERPSKSILYHLQKSSAEDFPDAQNALGSYYLKLKNPELAFKLYNQAAKKNHALAQYNLYACYKEGIGVKKNLPKAVEYLKKSANQGLPLSALHMGMMLYYGRGIKKNNQEAIKWLQEAIKENHPEAHYFLGAIYFEKKDEVMAIKHLEAGALLGEKEAAYNLYKYYSENNNEKKTIESLELAVKLGHKEAHYYLGHHYMLKNGSEDIRKGLTLWTKGHSLNDIKSILALAECYRSGTITEKNIDMANAFSKLAENLVEQAKREKLES